MQTNRLYKKDKTLKLVKKGKVTKIKKPLIGIVMGSKSDLPIMEKAFEILNDFNVAYEAKIVSAHRTPDLMKRFVKSAEKKGIKAIIAGAGGAAHLPGMLASYTALPVIGVPVNITSLEGMDSYLSIAQMPKGVPVATVAIDNATNAALLALRILGTSKKPIFDKLEKFRAEQTKKVLAQKI